MKIESIPLDEIVVQEKAHGQWNIEKGIEGLAASIRVLGLVQPITVYYKSDDKKYVIIVGKRRFDAHRYINQKYPGIRFGPDKQLPNEIKCIVIPEPKTNEEKLALSIAENITHVHMTKSDARKAVTDLWYRYEDYELLEEKLGLTKYMINKYVRLERLPEEIKDLIRQGGIHANSKIAENIALEAVDALGWLKNESDPSVQKVIQLAIELGKKKDRIIFYKRK